MSIFLELAFLFFIGSVSGWCVEVLFRRYISSANPDRKWINPGFCTGPYIPLYGFGLVILFLGASLGSLSWFACCGYRKALLFLVVSAAITGVEYIAGIFLLKVMKLRLWDYSGEWGNIQGVICPKFSLLWTLSGSVYYFLIHPQILTALNWFARNLTFSFVIGFFFGIFLIDVAQSAHLVVKLKQYAIENNVIVRYEHLKLQIRNARDRKMQRYHFFFPFRSDRPLYEHIKEMRESLEKRKR